MTGASLTLDRVNVHYGSFHALREVSLALGEGEIVCLLGGNASGKSTTMKTILGLRRPSSGRIVFDGTDITTHRTPARVRLGIASVPEARRVFGEMTVEENLWMGAFTHRSRRANRSRLAELYELFPRLAERRRQDAGTLSGGEQQMLAFGRALMSRPRLICMDEPTMGLAPVFVERVLDAIVTINRTLGVTALLVEQNAELALSIADRAYLLATGEVVLSGPSAELADHPRIRDAYLGTAPREKQ